MPQASFVPEDVFIWKANLGGGEEDRKEDLVPTKSFPQMDTMTNMKPSQSQEPGTGSCEWIVEVQAFESSFTDF